VEKARLDKVLQNTEIRTMITAIAPASVTAKVKARSISKTALPQDHHHDRRRRGRLAHPHIVAHVFYRQMPQLVKQGFVYIAQPRSTPSRARKDRLHR